MHKAIEICTGEIAVIQDADLEYDPEEYINLLRPILKGKADVVYGSRFMGGMLTGYCSSGILLVINS